MNDILCCMNDLLRVVGEAVIGLGVMIVVIIITFILTAHCSPEKKDDK